MENPDTKTTRSPQSLPSEETEPKKLKMSTTTTSDDEGTNTTTDTVRKQRYKRRKIAIFFAYCGVGYQGMQKNPGAKTIEGDFEEALYLSGAVPETERNNPKRWDWARSSRTDKGVSAVGQVVSGRFYIDPPGFVNRLNSNLSDQIWVFGYKRVTGSFNAKKFCDRRRYVYLIPAFALDSTAHRDRESVMASLGSGNEFVKCTQCSERGRKIGFLFGKRSYELKGVSSESGISSNNGDAMLNSTVSVDIKVSSVNGDAENPKSECRSKVESQNRDSDRIVASNDISELDSRSPNHTTPPEVGVNGEEKPVKKSGFCYGEKLRERFNRILKYYEGTHNFHNFTTRTKAEDPSALRFIVSFDANTTVTVEGIEFVKCVVVGQSFMLHQIRKMIGLAVAIMRNCAPESLIEMALQNDVNVNVPTAPELGLYLDECFFSSYNSKWKDGHEELSMKAYDDEAEEFKMKHIYSHIAATEHKEGVVGLWLHSLNYRNYADLRIVDNDGESTTNSNGVDGDKDGTFFSSLLGVSAVVDLGGRR